MDALHYVQSTNYKRRQITLRGRHVSMPKLCNSMLVGVELRVHIFVREMSNSSFIKVGRACDCGFYPISRLFSADYEFFTL
jgi:hypothetical protein